MSALDPLIRARLQDELLDLQAKLHRTIVFVSHDLDEAFKLGDRIAIMEGGRIVQCGTPRDIFTAPANDYVADFVAHMNPLGVLTARDVMRHTAGPMPEQSMPPDASVRAVMARIRDTGWPVSIVDGDKMVGEVTSDMVLRKLLDPRV